jgi:hypothetical protein
MNPSPQATRLAPKLIAFGAELVVLTAGVGASSVTPILLATYAAFLLAKTWSQSETATEAQAPVEQLLKEMIAKHKSLARALDAMETDQNLNEIISRERLSQLRELVGKSHQQILDTVAEHQEVTFHLARFIEDWCAAHDATLDAIEVSIEDLSKITIAGFQQSHANDALIIDKLDRLMESGPPPNASAIVPGTSPAPNELQVVGSLRHSSGTPYLTTLSPDSSIMADQLRQIMLISSGPLMAWPTTVGSTRARMVPALEVDLINNITESSTSAHLLLGPKGAGKSALTASIANYAVENNFAILGIRADQIPAKASSPSELVCSPTIPIALMEAVRIVAAKYSLLVIFDQLDAVSELTDRLSNRLNMLLNLIRELAGMHNVHILAACREFDYRHDARLSTIDATELRLSLPEWKEVASVLVAEGWSPDEMGEPMRDLLRTPWHLNLFLKVAEKGREYLSLQSLLEAVWSKCVINLEGPNRRFELINRIAMQMSKEEELFVPAATADDLPAERNALLTDEILVPASGARAIGFRHQTFYDYALARLFARGDKSLAEHVLEHQDGLFVRPTMLSSLELLRDTRRKEYIRQIRLLLGANVRTHVRSLLLEFIAKQTDPDAEEAAIILPLIMSDDGPLIFRAATGNRGWFLRFRDSGQLQTWMQQPPARAGLCIFVLFDALRFDQESVYRLVASSWMTAGYDQLTIGLAQYIQEWNDDWIHFVCVAIKRSSMSILFSASRIAEAHPDVAVKLTRAHLDSEYERATVESLKASTNSADDNGNAALTRYLRSRDNPFVQLLDGSREHGHYSLGTIGAKAPRAYVESILPWFVEVISRCPLPYRKRLRTYDDDSATNMAYDITPNPFIEALHSAADAWATIDAAGFAIFAAKAAEVEWLAPHRVLARALVGTVVTQAPTCLAYLTADPRRLIVGTESDVHVFSNRLISAVFPHLSGSERRELESAIIQFDAYEMTSYGEQEPEYRFEMKKITRQHRLRLLRAIPESLIGHEARILKETEERLLPLTNNYDRRFHAFKRDGPSLNANQIAKASDENVLHVMDKIIGPLVNSAGAEPDLEVRLSWETVEQSRTLNAVAEQFPDRALRLLTKLSPARADHQNYAGSIITGLGKSTLSAIDFFSTIDELDNRGFASDSFREDVASAIAERTNRGHIAPDALLAKMEQWLDQVAIPPLTENNDPAPTDKHVGPVVLGHGAMFSLTRGRGAVFRAIASSHGHGIPPQALKLINVARGRVGKELHPNVVAEMLLYLHAAFTVKSAMADATKVFGDLIDSCPEALKCNGALHELATLTGHFDPAERFQEWLLIISNSENPRLRQAYGELLFLYYGRRNAQWAAEQISKGLARNDQDFVRGAAYGAAQNWTLPHCRTCGADILCVAASHSAKEFGQILESAFYLTEGEAFLVDSDVRRVINSVCANPFVLKVAGSQILETIAPVAGTQPALVLDVSRAVLKELASDVAQLSGPIGTTAASLTSIAITLHRQENFRAPGLELFESLIRLGVAEAAAALDLLDRKANRPLMAPRPISRLRRRKPKE